MTDHGQRVDSRDAAVEGRRAPEHRLGGGHRPRLPPVGERGAESPGRDLTAPRRGGPPQPTVLGGPRHHSIRDPEAWRGLPHARGDAGAHGRDDNGFRGRGAEDAGRSRARRSRFASRSARTATASSSSRSRSCARRDGARMDGPDRVAGSVLVGDGRPALAVYAPADTPLSISAEDVQRYGEAGEEVVVIDLRPADAFRAGHLPRARSLPLGELKWRTAEIPRVGRVVLHAGTSGGSGRGLPGASRGGLPERHGAGGRPPRLDSPRVPGGGRAVSFGCRLGRRCRPDARRVATAAIVTMLALAGRPVSGQAPGGAIQEQIRPALRNTLATPTRKSN